jgi:transcription-repair coupling factor (superfamily II helicase)
MSAKELSPFGTDLDPETTFLEFAAIDPMRGDIDRAISALRQALEEHRTVVFATHGHGMLERYAGILRGADLPVQICEKLRAAPTKGSIHLTTSVIAHGFESAPDQIFFMTERDLTGSKGSKPLIH